MMDELLIAQQNDRRGYDAKFGAILNKIESQETKLGDIKPRLEKCCENTDSLMRRVDKLEDRHDSTSKDVDKHDQFCEVVNKHIMSTEMMHKTFIKHMEEQAKTNKDHADGIARTLAFQSKFLYIGGTLLALYQVFGSKMISAAEVLIK